MTRENAARAVVLAAGQGKRMKSALPKVLHDVLGKPVLGRIMDSLEGLGLEHIHVVTGHGRDQVEPWLAGYTSEGGRTPSSAHPQEPQLGTGHALQQVVPALDGFVGTLLVTVGDTPLLQAKTLQALLDQHRKDKAVVTLLTTVVEDAKNYGRIVRDENGKPLRIVEDKDCTQVQKQILEINPAIYCFAWPEIAAGLSSLKNNNNQGEYYLTDLLEWAVNNKLPVSSAVAPDWREVHGINSRLELTQAAFMLRDRTIVNLSLEHGVTILDPVGTWISPEVRVGADTTILPGSYLIGDIEIGSNCTIGPHTTMSGTVKIGDGTSIVQSLVVNSQIGADCKIGPFAHVREFTQISQQCRIGNFVEIKKSTIESGTNAAHLSYIGDAELGAKVNIGAGTITANYNHVTKAKSKTVIGAGSATGSNSVLVAPVIIGAQVSIGAGSVITKNVPDGALAVARARQENKADWVTRQLNRTLTKS